MGPKKQQAKEILGKILEAAYAREAARKAKVRFFSTIVTVTDLFRQGASEAIADAVKSGQIAKGTAATPGLGPLAAPTGLGTALRDPRAGVPTEPDNIF